MTTSNQDTVRQFYAVFASGDVAGFDSVLAEGWELKPALFGMPGTRAGEEQAIAYLHGVLDEITYTVEEIYDCGGGVVACRNTLRGTQRGPFLGLFAPGARIELMTMEFHTLVDGRIVRTWHLEDFYGVQQQLRAAGARPVP
jgi:ketosteroid isomerase-like protein